MNNEIYITILGYIFCYLIVVVLSAIATWGLAIAIRELSTVMHYLVELIDYKEHKKEFKQWLKNKK